MWEGGVVLLHQVAGVRLAVWYSGKIGRSARGDWRGLRLGGVAEVEEARYGQDGLMADAYCVDSQEWTTVRRGGSLQ